MLGKISSYWEERHYGFINGADGNQYFFHDFDLLDDFTPERGKKVTFELGLFKGRQKAVNVQVFQAGKGDAGELSKAGRVVLAAPPEKGVDHESKQ